MLHKVERDELSCRTQRIKANRALAVPKTDQFFDVIVLECIGEKGTTAPLVQLARSMKALYLIEVCIVDRGPYTTTLTLAHALMPQHGAIPLLSLTVRAYHDARLAEVIGYQNQSRFNPYYDYPNQQMRQRFEKRQVNLFLSEWLAYFRSGEPVLEIATDYGRA